MAAVVRPATPIAADGRMKVDEVGRIAVNDFKAEPDLADDAN